MRKIAGSILILIGVALVFMFGVRGSAGRTGEVGPGMPFTNLGMAYPWDAFYLAAGLWAVLGGIYLLWRNADNVQARPMAQTFVLSSFLLTTFVFAAYAGASSGKPAFIGLFMAMALLQVAITVILLLFAVFERPRGTAGLVVGGALFLAGTGVSLMVLLP